MFPVLRPLDVRMQGGRHNGRAVQVHANTAGIVGVSLRNRAETGRFRKTPRNRKKKTPSGALFRVGVVQLAEGLDLKGTLAHLQPIDCK